MEESIEQDDTEQCQCRNFAAVCKILDRFNHDPAKLVPVLQAVQEEYRYLPKDVMTFVATGLGIPPSRVYGVATFYSYFTLEARGKYTIRVCDGTACHVRNSAPLLGAIRKRLQVDEKNNTTKDMMFTVETVSCLGACGLAPVMMVNEEVYGLLTSKKVREIIDEIYAKEGA